MGDNGQRVVITGASSGIGRATALAFARPRVEEPRAGRLRRRRYTAVLGVHPGRVPLAVAGALVGTVAVRRRHRRG